MMSFISLFYFSFLFSDPVKVIENTILEIGIDANDSNNIFLLEINDCDFCTDVLLKYLSGPLKSKTNNFVLVYGNLGDNLIKFERLVQKGNIYYLNDKDLFLAVGSILNFKTSPYILKIDNNGKFLMAGRLLND